MLEKLLLLLFLYLPFQLAINPAPGIDLASMRLFVLIIFFFWLLRGLIKKKLLIPFSATTALLLSFLFINAFSLFFAENVMWGLRKLLFFLSIFPLYFIISDLLRQNKHLFLKLINFTLIGGFISALIGIIQFGAQFVWGITPTYIFWTKIITPFLGNSFSAEVFKHPSWLVNIGGHTFLRAIAFFPDPHMFSFYLGILSLISLGMFFNRKKRNFSLPGYFSADFYLFTFLILFFADLLTFSRGGYLGLLCGLVFFLLTIFLNNAKNINPLTILSTLSILFVIIFLFSSSNNIIAQRFLSTFNPAEGSNSGRLEIWRQSLNIIREYPLIGVGLGNYSLTIKPSTDYREPIYAHNIFLDIASESGVLNALIWLLLLSVAFAKFYNIYKRKEDFLFLGTASSLIVFTIHSLFETPLFSIQVLTLVILIFALTSLQKYDS